tara:strand:+ start:16036 stop:16956 length:921 start_codon:yes stop_codon:yes gene_type:complete
MKLKLSIAIGSLILFVFHFVGCGTTNNANDATVEEEIIQIDENDGTQESETAEEEESTGVNIVWKNWYLSVPINNGDGKATSIFYQTIENDALTEEQSEYFYKNEDGSYTMFTKFTGFTTSGGAALNSGKYCRTELREFWKGNQNTQDNWYMNTGTHILETTLNVDYVEGNGRTIIAQIHGKETEGLEGSPATVKIRWNSGTLQLDHYTKPNNGEPWTSAYDEKVDVAIVDNEVFTFKIKIENGKFYYALVCEAKNINIDYTFVYDYVGNGYTYQNYFKTGNYFGWYADYTKTAQVKLYKVVTEHF